MGHPLRLSHSSLELLNVCERKFQLEKLLLNEFKREETEHTVFGRAFGVGVASYMVHQDQDRAIFEAWMEYFPELESEKKNIPLCVHALINVFPKLDNLLDEYEVVSFNGKPAVELSFRIDIDEYFYFVGHIDVVLRNRYTGIHCVMDAKTTGLRLLDLAPLYKFSGQTVGYSIALDRIVGQELSDYSVMYLVAQMDAAKFEVKTHILTFDKTLLDRLNWFITLGQDVKRLEVMKETGVYPKRVTGCLNYNRPCAHFGTCHLHSFDQPKEIEEDPIVYDFVYELEPLINSHLERIGQ